MANNKFVLRDGTTLLDLTADTVTSASLAYGAKAHDASGAQITGTAQTFSFDNDGYFLYPETVIVPNTVTRIQSSVANGFYKHSEIKHIIYEDGLLPLNINGAYNFEECSGLIDCVLPTRYIGTSMPYFKKCTSLKQVNVPSSVTTMYDCFSRCTALETFEIPSSVTTLNSNTFYGCTSLASVTLPEGITSMGSSIFEGCTAITEIELPSTVASIGSSMFKGCTSLETITFKSIPSCSYYTYTTGSNPFYGCTALEDVVLPSGWNVNLILSNGSSYFTNVLTHDSLVAMIANLYDFSGDTAHTLTIGATNLARLSAAEQAVATAKNWTLA